MMDKMQNEDLVKSLLRRHGELKAERMPWESVWREIDERVNPLGGGGFDGSATAKVRGAQNFDVTAVEALDRFAAAMSSITVPRATQYIRLKFGDKDLDRMPVVRRWCERTADRLHAIRYAAHTGFQTQSDEDFRQLGTYGTGPLWIGEKQGLGLFYKSLHLSQICIDEDFSGQVDTIYRDYKWTARKIAQEFGEGALTPKMAKAFAEDKSDLFELLHVIRPNPARDPDAFDWRGMPVESINLAVDEKMILRRKGFYSSPIAVSRHVTGTGDKYGRSPAMKVLPAIRGVNVMQRDILKAGAKSVDPALAFFNDDGISSVSSKPNGMNPGLVDQQGRMLIHRMPGGEDGIPYGIELRDGERKVINTAFLEEYFMLLREGSVQRSATAVLEIAAKQGVLVAPFAGRYESEKQNPVTLRELDLAMRAGQVDPFPPEVLEAGGYPMPEYENPLSRMARAERAAGFTRYVEAMAPIAQIDGGAAYDWIDTDVVAPELGETLGMPASWLRTPEAVAALRKDRSTAETEQQGVEQFATAAGAFRDLAAGNAQMAAA